LNFPPKEHLVQSINYEAQLVCGFLHLPVTSSPSGTNTLLTSHVMTQVIICQPLTTEGWVRLQVNSCGIFDRQGGNGAGFLQVLGLLLVSIFPPLLGISLI
jgi:hypothetical protein